MLSSAFGLTAYTAGLSGVIERFDISTTKAIAPFSLYLFGIAFAPIHTPHLSERYGRVPVYLVCLPVWMLFILGAGLAKNYATLAVCRFFAGFAGGPCLVLIEGTFADVWAVEVTLTYYSGLTLASYVGAACGEYFHLRDMILAYRYQQLIISSPGPLIAGFLVTAKDWRWTQYITLMLGLGAYFIGLGMPETYAREIVRSRARRHGMSHHQLSKAESGVTLREMAQITFFTPLKMLISEPLVILISLYLSFNFALLFQWFITVPAALQSVYGFTLQQAGLAFVAAAVGVVLAAVVVVVLDRILAPRAVRKSKVTMRMEIEYRLYPAMIGAFLMFASLFWVGFTVKPSVNWPSPVLGTMLYVFGSALVLVSLTRLFHTSALIL